MDGSTYYIKADFLIRNGVFVSEEKIYALKPANTYMITLKIDDEVISKWDIQGVNHSYIAFEHNGNLIKKQTLPNYSVILILKNNRKILDKGIYRYLNFRKFLYGLITMYIVLIYQIPKYCVVHISIFL